MNLAIRADSSENIGTGHIVRCVSLAKELRKSGIKVYFISKNYKGNILKLVKKNKFLLTKLDQFLSIKEDISATSKILEKYKIDSLILDNYNLNSIWEKSIKKKLKKLIVISDSDKNHFCDILINYNILQNKKKYFLNNNKSATRVFFGLRYAILNDEYQKIKKKINIKKKLKKINIFFGGFKESLELLEIVIDIMSSKALRRIKLDIIPGLNQKITKTINYKLNNRGNYNIHQNLPSLAKVIKNADLGIGCGGTANLERLCLGIPSVVFLAAKNQELLGNALAKKDFIIKVKKKNNLINKKHLSSIIKKIYKNQSILEKYSKKNKLLVDGLGSKRIAGAILGYDNSNLKIRKADKKDSNVLYDMVNDIEVRNNAFNKKFIMYNDHLRWFKKKIKNNNAHIFIAEDLNKLAIGQVRFDYLKLKKKYLVDISIDECARGYGIGKLLLTQAIKKIPAKNLKSKKFFAYVLNKNYASHKLFLDCNFSKIKKNLKFTEYEYYKN